MLEAKSLDFVVHLNSPAFYHVPVCALFDHTPVCVCAYIEDGVEEAPNVAK